MIRSSTLARSVAAGFLCAVVVTADLSAQRGPPSKSPANRTQLERRVRERFAEMIKARLGLTDEQSDQLSRTVASFQEQRQRLVSDEQALRRRTEAVLSEDKPDEQEARSILERMREMREEEVRVFEDEQQALQQILTPVQLVRFHAMREQLGQRIQQLRGGGGPGEPGRSPGEGLLPGIGWPDATWEHLPDPGL